MTRLRLGALLGAIMALAAGSTALVFALPAAASASASSRSFWVSPNGRSSATGTRGDPFATLQQARDAVRAVSHVRGDIVVNIENGTYRLSRPLSFTSRDSGRGGHDVVYRAAPGAHPIISGARSVPGRDWAVQNATLNIWRAHVGDVATQQLYVDGERATLAQTTASPVGFLPHWVKDPTVSGIQYQVTSLNPARWADPTAWSAPGDVEAVIDTQWKTMIVPVSSVTAPVPGAPGLLTMQQPAWDNANVFVDAKTQMPGIWSFWQVTRFQNAYEFLDSPGEWYLDRAAGDLFYIPLPGQRMDNAKVELPVLETLVRADGSATRPVAHLRIEGLTFTGATWLAPASRDGYVSDQSGFHLTGSGHRDNVIGHERSTTATPGNIELSFARDVTFRADNFTHLGATALSFPHGAQRNRVVDSTFSDISSAAIQIGSNTAADARPRHPGAVTRDNTVSGNDITNTGRDYVDAAGIYLGFTRHSIVTHNHIAHVPWSGIAVGWGWGLLDKGSFPGLPGSHSGEWGPYRTDNVNGDSIVSHNLIEYFIENRWDGGAVYTTGQQGRSAAHGLVIEANVARDKRPDGGGNTFYTDGGSRYVTVARNLSYDNPIGVVDLGPAPATGDPLPYPAAPSLGNGQPYGSDAGGCTTFGDITYRGNSWQQPPFAESVAGYNKRYQSLLGLTPYSADGFFDVCPYKNTHGTSYPTNLRFAHNHVIDPAALPPSILEAAGPL